MTAIVIYADKIAVGASNGTVINGKGKPDLKAVERIKRYIRGKYGDVKTEAYYSQSATPLVEMAGDYPVYTYYRSDGQYRYNLECECTLGYLGYLYGDPNLPVIITAWHCFGFVGTDRTSPYSAEVFFTTPRCTSCRITAPGNGLFNPSPYFWDCSLPQLYVVLSDSALIGVRGSNYFENTGLRFGYVRKADGFNDLPIVGQLRKYDVKVGDKLWLREGHTGETVSLTVNSLCRTAPYAIYLFYLKFAIATSCRVSLDSTQIQMGDSGSPVYVLRLGQSGYVAWAYGILSGKRGILQ